MEKYIGDHDLTGVKLSRSIKQRLRGKLNTVDIAGHTFYVDLPMDMLRPKDDFLSDGIHFKDIEYCLSDDASKYCIPYDPVKREFREIDYNKITEIPKDLIVIEFPYERELDLVGYSRKHNLELKNMLSDYPFKGRFTAKIIDWDKTGICQIISRNIENKKIISEKIKTGKRIKRGRSI